MKKYTITERVSPQKFIFIFDFDHKAARDEFLAHLQTVYPKIEYGKMDFEDDDPSWQ